MTAADRRLRNALIAAFLLAIVLGAGPGIHLVNPDPAGPRVAFTTLGLPTIYAWGLAWYAVQLTVIVVAYRRFWRPGADDERAATDA